MQGPVGAFVTQFATDTGIQLVPIPAGRFMMGSPVGEAGRQVIEGPQTQVTLTQDFFLGATVITQAQWQVITRRDRSIIKGTDLPEINVSWEEATEFCRKLTVRQRTAGQLPEGYAFTLPTEAQWEYACRAGTTTACAGDLDAMAWYLPNSGNVMHPVGMKQANGWGLFDMHGNVWQWCRDWSGLYPGGSVNDPTGSVAGSFRVYRGGGWWNDAANLRSASRNNSPSFRSSNIGFRLALAPAAAR
jgi:formylglycine-generating enzyme required for sulfatase activity